MSNRNKILLGVGGVTGAAVVAWKTLFPWIGDDIKYIRLQNRAIASVMKDMENGRYIIDMFEEVVASRPNQTFLIFEGKLYTYGFVNQMANRVANLAATWNLKQLDTVAIMITNEPAFIWTFLGLQKIGLNVAFINYHLTDEPLSHSVITSGGKILIIGSDPEFLDAVEEIRGKLPEIPIYVQGRQPSELIKGYISMDSCLERTLPADICRSARAGINPLSNMCYIYTSGTTGLPKPAIVSQAKGVAVSKFWISINATKNDIVYISTPLYHSAAFLVGLCNVLNFGCTAVIKRKFSAHQFFEDCRKYDVTVIQYIGEMCRYLLRLPKDPLDGVHKIRVAFGNGLRPDIWEEFQTRFKIPHIAEFFGATEGIGSLLNIFDKVGACGRVSPLMKRYLPGFAIELVKHDPITDQPIRDKNGRCIKIKPGQEGLIIALMPPTKTEFYKGTKEMNEKKIIRNSFTDGDAYFSYGDLVYLDKQYYVYFRDRVGDTFRWKGENVSTLEVGHVLTGLDFIQDANVYGVQIPGSDGRAGMAAIMLKDKKEVTSEMIQEIYKLCHHSLPSYARPMFLRFMQEFVVTQTMKHRKVELREEGFDPNKISDPLYYLDELQHTYVPLNQKTFQRVLESKL